MKVTYLEGRYVIVPAGHTLNQYDYGRDAFGYRIANNQHHWHSCRDKVQGVAPEFLRAGMIFTHETGRGPDVAAFLNKIENMLELKEQTVFRETDLPKALWMKLSPFWLSSFMRRSFLTMILRCGARYNRASGDFDAALRSIPYAAESMPAVYRFLAGFTHYVGAPTNDNSLGWHRIFVSKDAAYARQFLKADEELISKRAYLKYVERMKHGIEGCADADWHQAVAELGQE